MFHEVWELERFQTAKMTFKQGHSRSMAIVHSIGHMRFPIRFNCNHVSILQRFRDIITYFPFPQFKEVTWPQTHPFQG